MFQLRRAERGVDNGAETLPPLTMRQKHMHPLCTIGIGLYVEHLQQAGRVRMEYGM